MRIATIALYSVFAAAYGHGLRGLQLPPPNDEFAAAQTDVGRAEAGGAPTVPDAKLHLQLAQEDLQKSKDLIDKDNKRAASLHRGRARRGAARAQPREGRAGRRTRRRTGAAGPSESQGKLHELRSP